jgi:sugar/nucleoside kinase (ribokinase family)
MLHQDVLYVHQMPPTAATNVAESSRNQPTVLIIGACCLDRILTVDEYPLPDSKVRTTNSQDVGGGNAANTATAMALLAKSKCFKTRNSSNSCSGQQDNSYSDSLRIKLISKLGDDVMGDTLLQNLRKAGVDTTCVIQAPNSTTSLTTVIVDSSKHTRTCLHSPGSCGELTPGEIQTLMDRHNLVDNDFVIHVHSDGRHSEAALVLAQQARLLNIPVSVDIEKDIVHQLGSTANLPPTTRATVDARTSRQESMAVKSYHKPGRKPLVV